MTLTDYALATEQERSVASRDLKRMLSKTDCGITTRGSASHKVWVKSEPGVLPDDYAWNMCIKMQRRAKNQHLFAFLLQNVW